VIQVELKEGHKPTADYVKKLRQVAAGRIPGGHLLFPGGRYGDADSEFRTTGGRSTSETVGYDKGQTLRLQGSSVNALPQFPGIVDAHLQQEVDGPAFYAQIEPDSRRSAWPKCEHGRLPTSMSASARRSRCRQISGPIRPRGFPYFIAVQTPEYRINSLNALAKHAGFPPSLAASGQTVPWHASAMLRRFKRDKGAHPTRTRPISSRFF